MNINDMKTNWKTVRPKVHTKWDKLTEADLTAIGQKPQDLVDRVEKRYSLDHEKAQKAVTDFMKTLS